MIYCDPLPIRLPGNCSSKNESYHCLISSCGGFVKDQICKTRVCDLADLQERIYAAVNSVTLQMLHNTWVEVEYRLDISRATNGSHVEVYGTLGKKNPSFHSLVSSIDSY